MAIIAVTGEEEEKQKQSRSKAEEKRRPHGRTRTTTDVENNTDLHGPGRPGKEKKKRGESDPRSSSTGRSQSE